MAHEIKINRPALLQHLIGKKLTACFVGGEIIETQTTITAVDEINGVACIWSQGIIKHSSYLSAKSLGELLLTGYAEEGEWQYEIND